MNISINSILCLVLCLAMNSVCLGETSVKIEKSKNFDVQAIKRIAIIPFNNDGLGLGRAVSDALATELMAMGFDVVERAQFNSILSEIKLDNSGAITATQGQDLSRLLNVDGYVFGSIFSNVQGEIYTLNIRLVDIRSGEVLLSSNYFASSGKKVVDVIDAVIASINPAIFNKPRDKRSSGILSNNYVAKRKKYKKVALLRLMGPFGYGEEDAFSGILTTELIGCGLELVERKDLMQILNEQNAYAAGLFDQGETGKTPRAGNVTFSTNTISELSLSQKDLDMVGRLTGAEGVLVGSFSPIYSEEPFRINVANLRLIDIQTGRVMWGVSYYRGAFNTTSSLPDVASLMATAIVPAVTTDNYADFSKAFNVAYERTIHDAKLIIDYQSVESYK